MAATKRQSKSAGKSGRNAGSFKPGKDPRRGRGPKPGAPNAGRPPDEFKKFMQSLADSDDAKKGLQFLLKTRGKLFLGALKHVTEHGYGKPTQDLTSGGKPLPPASIAVRLVPASGDS